MALVARTAADARDVMVEGESGLLAISPPWNRPRYEPSKRRVTWPNGAIATTYSADEPDLLRGPQHDRAWCDELAAWAYPDEAWSNLRFGLRLSATPRVLVTTTPRPTKLVRELVKDDSTRLVRGSTYDNRANLPDALFAAILRQYEGTRLGRQEIMGEILDDAPGALFQRARIDASRVAKAPHLTRVVVGVDPAASSSEDSDETGIIVVGLGEDGHGYVLEDLSGRYPPEEWAALAVGAYHRHQADCIVAEVNMGGDMVATVI